MYNVLIGRNVVIYDSDYHQIIGKDGHVRNQPIPVVIGNHVWIASNVTILKGAHIGDHCVIGANSMIIGTISNNSLVFPTKDIRIIKNLGEWNRQIPLAKWYAEHMSK